ncbi:MAG: Bcr/CflA family efflux MFS transporter [Pseudomonadota bacterium]
MNATARPPQQRAPKGLLAILTLLATLAMLATNLYLPSMPRLAEEFGTTAGGARATLTVFLAAFALSQLAWGPLSDAWGRRRVLTAGLVLYALAAVACALASSLDALLAARAVQGIGACAASTLVRAIARDWFEGAELAHALAVILTLMTAAPGFSPLLGGLIEATLGWRADFALLAACGAAAALLAWTCIPDRGLAPVPLSPRALLRSYRHIATTPEFLAPTLATSLGVAGLFAFFAAAPTIFMQHLGVSAVMFGLVPAGLVFALFAGGTMPGMLRRRLGTNGAILVAIGLMAAGGLGMCVLVLARPLGWINFVLPLLPYLAGIGIINPVATAAAMQPFPRNAGAAAALNGFCQLTGAAFGTALLALFPMPAALPITLAICAIAALCAFALFTARRPAAAADRPVDH